MELVKKAESGVGLEAMLRQADLYVQSGFFPKHIDTKEKAVVIMMKGRELGLPFTEALGKICVINGVATTKVETLLGLARRTGQMEDFKQRFVPNEINPQYCEVTIKRKGQSAHTCRFGDDEAATMGLTQKDNYKKQKATMYSWRAISKNLRVTFPDAIGGLYLEEEIADDVVIQTATEDQPAQVTEIITHSLAAPEPLPVKPQESNLSADDLPEDQLPNWVMPIGKYANKRLADIYADKNETGKPRGKEYLQWVAGNWKDENQKSIVTRFLEMIENPSVDIS
jgi:hypothetical protein